MQRRLALTGAEAATPGARAVDVPRRPPTSQAPITFASGERSPGMRCENNYPSASSLPIPTDVRNAPSRYFDMHNRIPEPELWRKEKKKEKKSWGLGRRWKFGIKRNPGASCRLTVPLKTKKDKKTKGGDREEIGRRRGRGERGLQRQDVPSV